MSENLKKTLALIASGEKLAPAQAETAFQHLMSGEAKDAEIGALLMGLHMRGETTDEIAAAAKIMRAAATPVQAPKNAIDLCGTGGDMKGSLNISTAASFIVAACGVPVAKHGNRALSSRSGAADVLSALGAETALPPQTITQCIKETGIGFLFAPSHHPAARHVAPARAALGIRTIFNLLGPLCNPANVKRQLIGVFAPEWLKTLAEVLRDLGSERVWIVHGSDGMDEITLSGETRAAELKDGKVRPFTITPEEAGLPRAPSDSLKGGTPQQNAAALRRLLDGESGAYRDAAVLNAAAALVIAEKAGDLREGAALASESLSSGRAADTFHAFRNFTKKP